MSKPDFDPKPGKVWAIQIYPGGRRKWVEVSSVELAYALADAAIARIARGHVVLVPDEEIADIVSRKREKAGWGIP